MTMDSAYIGDTMGWIGQEEWKINMAGKAAMGQRRLLWLRSASGSSFCWCFVCSFTWASLSLWQKIG